MKYFLWCNDSEYNGSRWFEFSELEDAVACIESRMAANAEDGEPVDLSDYTLICGEKVPMKMIPKTFGVFAEDT